MPGLAGKGAICGEHQSPTLDGNVVLAAKGVAVVFVGRMLSIPERLVLGFLLARVLGAEQYGLYNLALSAAAIAGTLAILGLDLGLVRYVSAFAGRRDEAGLSGALRVGLGVPAVFGTLFGLALIALANPIATEVLHEPRVGPLLYLTGLIVPFIALNEVFAAATRGFKNQHYSVAAKHVCQPLVKIAALLALAVVGLNSGRAIMAFGIAEVSTSALLLYFLNRQFPLRRLFGAVRANARQLFAFSLPVYLSATVNTVASNIQAIVLAATGSVAAVGVYAVASQAGLLSRPLMSSVTTASMPIISELHDQGNKRHLSDFYQITTKWTFTLNLPVFLIVVMFPGPLLALFGESYLTGAMALTILAWEGLVKTATGTNGPMLDMTGYTKLKLLNSVVAAISTVGLSFLLVPRLGVVGAALAILSGTFIVEVLRLAEVYFLHRLIPYNATFLKPVMACVTAALTAYGLEYLLSDMASHFRALTISIAICLVYGGAILALGLTPDDRMLLGRLSQRLKKLSR